MNKRKNKIKVVPEMFDEEETPLTSREQAHAIALTYPIRVQVKRYCDKKGEFVREILVQSDIYYKTKYGAGCLSYITSYLITRERLKDEPPDEYCWAIEYFKTREEGEKWVSEKLKEIKEKRKEIITRQKEEKLADRPQTIIFDEY